MDFQLKFYLYNGPYTMRRPHPTSLGRSTENAMSLPCSSDTLNSAPFRLLDLPFEIRSEILCMAISNSNHSRLDREVVTFGESLKSITYIRGRIVWRDSNGVYLNLLTTSKQIYDEVQHILFTRFAFDALGWGYMMKYSDPSKTPNHLPKHRIMHITYTPYFSKYMREHRQSADLILSGLPLLRTVRILVSWACAQRLITCDAVKVGSLHIVAVARLFREVGKVAVVGQSLMNNPQKQLVMDAREELQDEPWYWELDLDYPLYIFTSAVEEHL